MWIKTVKLGFQPKDVRVFLYGLNPTLTAHYESVYGFPVIAKPENYPGFSIHTRTLDDLLSEYPIENASLVAAELKKLGVLPSAELWNEFQKIIKSSGPRFLLRSKDESEKFKNQSSEIYYIISGDFQKSALQDVGQKHGQDFSTLFRLIAPKVSRLMNWEYDLPIQQEHPEVIRRKDAFHVELFPDFDLKDASVDSQRIQNEFFAIVKNESGIDLDRTGFYIDIGRREKNRANIDHDSYFQTKFKPLGFEIIVNSKKAFVVYISGKKVRNWIRQNPDQYELVSASYFQDPEIQSYREGISYLP